MIDKKFWKNKKVLITGHTGFKGSWLTRILLNLNANVVGISINFKKHSLLKNKSEKLKEYVCDIRNKSKITKIFSKEKPEIVFHLAAQTLVIESYINPINTYEINLIGTINILSQLVIKNKIRSMIIVSSDKCYKVNKTKKYLDEIDELGGNDPYSGSKSSCEHIINSFLYFNNKLPITSVRAGNVIGGGDWNDNRLVPDIFKSIYMKKVLQIRNSNSIRPWQHVLEPISGYMILAQKIYLKKINKNIIYPWNFGPNKISHKRVIKILDYFEARHKLNFKKLTYKKNKYVETEILLLSSRKSKRFLDWNNKINFKKTLDFTNEWYVTFFEDKRNINELTDTQIDNFFNLL